MDYLNFVSCGRLGDFIHVLRVVKGICERENKKANVYISDKVSLYGGDKWNLSLDRAYIDLHSVVIAQEYINEFRVVPDGFEEDFYNLNEWRHTYCENGWSELLSKIYLFDIEKSYKWIDCNKVDKDLSDKMVIHRSLHRHNDSFDWEEVINRDEDIFFITSSIAEWQRFQYKRENVKLKLVSTIEEMAAGINSSKLFVGNQSAPFALASALDVNRLVELCHENAKYYIAESNRSDNISWYLDNDRNFFNEKCLIKTLK